jgi:hypothetical protein
MPELSGSGSGGNVSPRHCIFKPFSLTRAGFSPRSAPPPNSLHYMYYVYVVAPTNPFVPTERSVNRFFTTASPRAEDLHVLGPPHRAPPRSHVRSEPLHASAIRGLRAVAGDLAGPALRAHPSQHERRGRLLVHSRRIAGSLGKGHLDGRAHTAGFLPLLR